MLSDSPKHVAACSIAQIHSKRHYTRAEPACMEHGQMPPSCLQHYCIFIYKFSIILTKYTKCPSQIHKIFLHNIFLPLFKRNPSSAPAEYIVYFMYYPRGGCGILLAKHAKEIEAPVKQTSQKSSQQHVSGHYIHILHTIINSWRCIHFYVIHYTPRTGSWSPSDLIYLKYNVTNKNVYRKRDEVSMDKIWSIRFSRTYNFCRRQN